MPDDPCTIDPPLSFGVSAATGRPLPQIDAASLAALLADGTGTRPEALEAKQAIASGVAYAVVSDIPDPNDLSRTGWGVVFARGTDPEAVAALEPLLARRRREAGALFKVFEGGDAPAPGESAAAWLARHGSSLNIVDPHHGVPFYLLLVGDPTALPYEFQYTLDIYWAVGRLAFDTPDEYRRYAASVVAYETADPPPGRKRIAVFAPEHDFDRATQLFAWKVARALVDEGSPHGPVGRRAGFATEAIIGDGGAPERRASRGVLRDLLAGAREGGLPALLVTGSHGMEFASEDDRRRAQGAIVCQDWDGYGAIAREHWFEAGDLPADASLAGLVHLFFACYSAGYPEFDDYARTADAPRRIADAPRIAPLPQAMLAHPAGGALASIGHIDRAWAYSFLSDRSRGQVQGFRDVLARLAAGHRVGYATDQFNIRWAALSADLAEAIADRKGGADVSDAVLANRWVARDDARNYVILGDPAVRLRASVLQGGPD